CSGAIRSRYRICRAASYPQPIAVAKSPMVSHRPMRSETDVGALLMIATYKTYDALTSQNRTPGTMEFCHTFRMELPKHRLQAARRDAGYDSPTDAANAIRDIN